MAHSTILINSLSASGLPASHSSWKLATIFINLLYCLCLTLGNDTESRTIGHARLAHRHRVDSNFLSNMMAEAAELVLLQRKGFEGKVTWRQWKKKLSMSRCTKVNVPLQEKIPIGQQHSQATQMCLLFHAPKFVAQCWTSVLHCALHFFGNSFLVLLRKKHSQRIWNWNKSCPWMAATTKNEHVLCFLLQFSCSKSPSSTCWPSCCHGNAHFHLISGGGETSQGICHSLVWKCRISHLWHSLFIHFLCFLWFWQLFKISFEFLLLL